MDLDLDLDYLNYLCKYILPYLNESNQIVGDNYVIEVLGYSVKNGNKGFFPIVFNDSDKIEGDLILERTGETYSLPQMVLRFKSNGIITDVLHRGKFAISDDNEIIDILNDNVVLKDFTTYTKRTHRLENIKKFKENL